MNHPTDHEYVYHIAMEADYNATKQSGTYSHESLDTVRTRRIIFAACILSTAIIMLVVLILLQTGGLHPLFN
jgi:hypothetical protein